MTGTAVCLGLLVPATAVAVVPAALAVLGRLPRRRPVPQLPQALPCVIVLIPAHDEERTLPAALHSLKAQDYPPDRIRVVVVADNCRDDTAAVAAACGAAVVIRTDPSRKGKGYALAAGFDAIRDEPFDVVLILDADCLLSSTALREMTATFATGAEVVQAVVRSRNAEDGAAGLVAAVGAAVDAAVAAGLDRIGRTGRLRGTGMAFRRSVLGRVRWATGSPVEDAEYDRQLRAAGVRVRYCAGAEVQASAPARVADLCRQRLRWAAAGPAGSKPLGLALTALAIVACLVSGEFVAWAGVLALLVAAVYVPAAVGLGLNRRRLGLLFATPVVVARLAVVAVVGWLKPVGGWAA
ncbi:MAG TPA: glycosyltransferase family 2 protein [Urbifossiella sp.]|nr:glycosyltransferase family 2 protein [Urbifossiella sp.]